MRGCRFSFLSVFLLGFGLVFVGVGAGLATLGAGDARAAAERAERLAPLSAAALEDGQPGREALVEGRVSARNPALFQDLVAYVREEYRGSDDNRRDMWAEDERRTPALLIDLPDGAASLADGQYALDNPPQSWQEPGGKRWDGFAGEGTKRYRGLRAGDQVVAVGTLVEGREGLELRAEWVYGGTRAQYIEGQRGSAAFLPWFGGLFALIGAVVAGIGVWTLARRR